MKEDNVLLHLRAYKAGELLYDFPLNKKKLLIGSSENCDIQLNEESISAYHAILFINEHGIDIQDLRSITGIAINGCNCQTGFISTNDKLLIGNILFSIEEEVIEQKIIIEDYDKDIKPTVTIDQSYGLKPIEGLTVIDNEYCDITFETGSAKECNLDLGDLDKKYVDFDEKEITEDNVVSILPSRQLQMLLIINGNIISDQYLPLKDNTFYLANQKSGQTTFVLDELYLEKKVPLFKVQGEDFTLLHESFFDQQQEDNKLIFTHEDIRIEISVVNKIVRPKWAPFFEWDKYFQKINAQTMGAIFSICLLLLLVDTSLPPKPQKVAIIYKLQKPIAKKMKANDPVNNNSNPGQNNIDAPPKQQLAKATKRPLKNKKRMKKIVKKVAAKSSKKVAKKKIRTYKFKSKAIASLLKTTNKINIKTSAIARTTTTAATTTSDNLAQLNYKGVKQVKGRSPASFSRVGNLNSLGGRGLISKTGIDTSFATTKTVVLGSMDPELLRKILKEYLPQFRQCYQQELLKKNKKLEGVIALDFRIGKKGRVLFSNVRVQNARFSKQGTNCMNRVLSLIKFPKPRGGGFVDVTQPLNFYAEREIIN